MRALQAPQALALLQALARDVFGPCAALVVCILQKLGPATSRELQTHTALETRVLQNVLLVLYKHGILRPEITLSGDASLLKYALDADAILMLLRRSRYLKFVEARWGIPGKHVLLQFLKFGFAYPEAACQAAAAEYQQLAELLYGPEAPSTISLGKLKAAFESMFNAGIFTVCVAMDDLYTRAQAEALKVASAVKADPLSNLKSTRAKTAARKRADDDRKTTKVRTVRRRVVGEAETSYVSNAQDARRATENFLSALGEPSAPSPPGTPMEVDNAPQSAPSSESRTMRDTPRTALVESACRINQEHLNLEMTKMAVENFLALRWSNAVLVRLVCRALLRNARRHDAEVMVPPVGFEDICSMVNRFVDEDNQIIRRLQETGESDPGGFYLNSSSAMLTKFQSDQIFKALDMMCRHGDKAVKLARRETGTSYQLDWQEVRSLMQTRIVQQLVKTRYGPEASRVFALILDRDGKSTSQLRADTPKDHGSNDNSLFLRYNRFWSDSEISAYALVSPEQARSAANALAAGGYINKHLADAVGAAPSTTQNKHYWVFATTQEIALQAAVTSCLRYIANVFERKQVEVEKLQKLALKAEQVTEQVSQEVTAREYAEDVLEASLAGIDQSLLVLREL